MNPSQKEQAKRESCKEMIKRLPYDEIDNIRKYLFKIWRKYHKLEDLHK